MVGVGAEHQSPDRTDVGGAERADRLADRLAVVRVPDLHESLRIPRDQVSAVGAERHGKVLRPGRERGFALLPVLMVTALLALIAGSMATAMRTENRIAQAQRAASEGRAIADAASTMPSERPNFIFRGARFATIGVRRPIRSSGLYADLMPAKTVRWRPSPMSSVSFRSLSAPSTCSALTILAMRRSIFEKSSIEIVVAVADSVANSVLASADWGVKTGAGGGEGVSD